MKYSIIALQVLIVLLTFFYLYFDYRTKKISAKEIRKYQVKKGELDLEYIERKLIKRRCRISNSLLIASGLIMIFLGALLYSKFRYFSTLNFSIAGIGGIVLILVGTFKHLGTALATSLLFIAAFLVSINYERLLSDYPGVFYSMIAFLILLGGICFVIEDKGQN